MVKSELESLRVPQSVHELTNILENNSITELIQCAKEFLQECALLRVAQEKFSAMHDRSMAALVYPTLQQLIESSETAPLHMIDAISGLKPVKGKTWQNHSGS